MAERKLIIPVEVKVCATCSYWDGERHFDEEVGVVVVAESCQGECIVQEEDIDPLTDVRSRCDCLWEDLRAADSELTADDDSGVGGEAVDKR